MEKHGVHPLHDAAIAAHELRHALRALAGDESINDVVGLTLAANLVDQVAKAIDDQWRSQGFNAEDAA